MRSDASWHAPLPSMPRRALRRTWRPPCVLQRGTSTTTPPATTTAAAAAQPRRLPMAGCRQATAAAAAPPRVLHSLPAARLATPMRGARAGGAAGSLLRTPVLRSRVRRAGTLARSPRCCCCCPAQLLPCVHAPPVLPPRSSSVADGVSPASSYGDMTALGASAAALMGSGSFSNLQARRRPAVRRLRSTSALHHRISTATANPLHPLAACAGCIRGGACVHQVWRRRLTQCRQLPAVAQHGCARAAVCTCCCGVAGCVAASGLRDARAAACARAHSSPPC